MYFVRVARESGPGQYAVVAERATLCCEASTLSLATVQSGAQPLLHMSLQQCKLGLSGDKLLVVPNDRGACWLCGFIDAGASSRCAAALQALGFDLALAPGKQQPVERSPEEVLAALQHMSSSGLERVLDALLGSRHQQ